MNLPSLRKRHLSVYPLAILIAALVAALPSHATAANWLQLGADIDGEAADDYSGYSVSLSSDGSRVAIGATGNGDNGENSGHVRIFEWDGGAWSQMGSDIDGEAADDESGNSVSLSSNGSRVAIGAPNSDGNGSNSGHARIFEWNGTAWSQLGTDIDGEAADDYSGWSVSLSSDGNRVAIGAWGNDGSGSVSGHVRIFEWDGGAWSQMGTDIDGEAVADYSGGSVSLSSDGSRVAIGALNNGGNGSVSGHVRIFEWGGGVWSQMGSDIDGEAAADNSGYSVSLSSNGSRVAIGAVENDGNGSSSGHVRIFSWDGAAWSQLGSDIDGEDANDQSGYSVSLSSDGSRVAIGARLNDGNASNSGHVRIFASVACGNDQVELSETCDDGNTEGGDGCSSRCQIEAAQSKDQQKCIALGNTMAIKVAAAQSKENLACLKLASRGKLPEGQDFDACLEADNKSKMVKVAAKLKAVQEGKVDDPSKTKCPETPDFGYVDDEEIFAAVVDEEIRFFGELLGDDMAAAAVDATDKANKKRSLCQQIVLKASDKVLQAQLKEFLACKKDVLKYQYRPAVSAEDLEFCFSAITSDAKGKTEKARVKLVALVAKKCIAFGDEVSDVLDGACGQDTGTPAEYSQCVVEAGLCTSCRLFNAADDLAHDCDVFDDGEANDSCGE